MTEIAFNFPVYCQSCFQSLRSSWPAAEEKKNIRRLLALEERGSLKRSCFSLCVVALVVFNLYILKTWVMVFSVCFVANDNL